MCGICGIINFNRQPVVETDIRSMMKEIRHRGPNDDGVFIDSNCGFGFVRLSILDLSMSGHQPMFDDSGRYMIVHNGEVYNYLELRKELKSQGYKFNSNTDTEVILKSYIEWGENYLYKFNGMWAFAIYDNLEKSLFLSRDRFGIKPLYYYLDQDRFIFASEIPSILAVLPNKPSANYQSIFDFLIFNRTDQTESTFFAGIIKFQHGFQMKIDLAKNSRPIIQMKRWYDLRKTISETAPFSDEREFREMFYSTIDLRLRSDVPVGVCLSGGLDSSSIVSVLLDEFNKTDLNTFSAVYGAGQYGDESRFINEYRGLLKNMFFTTPSAETLYADIDNFIQAMAEPVPWTNPYAQFKVMELAREKVVVLLDGQGADEGLAGYHYFFGYYFKDLLRHFKLPKLFSEMLYYLWLHKSFFGWTTFLYFLLPEKIRTKARISEKGYLNEDFSQQYKNTNTIAGNLYGSSSLQDALIDHFEFKLEHLLKWEDRNSMWFSLESRVPFLDYRLVEKTVALSSDQIIEKGMTKSILRKSMKGILPEKIRMRRDKIGFLTPQDEWFRTEKFQQLILNILQSDSFRKREIIRQPKAIELYKKHCARKIHISREIWKWINLELWFRKYIDESQL